MSIGRLAKQEPTLIPTTVAIDLSKSVFEIAVADADGTVIERERFACVNRRATWTPTGVLGS